MMKKLLLALALSTLGSTAFAACTNPLNVKDAASATITMSVIAGADTFCQYSFNLANVGGNAPLTGNGATGTGSLRVTMANDNTVPTGWPTAANQTAASAARGEGATGAAVPSGAVYMGRNSAGNLVGWDGSVTQSGTWTFQPGNTANTTPWLASISQGGNTAVVKAANTVASSDVGVVVAVANTNANVANNANGITPGATAGSPVVNYNYGYNAVGNVWDRPVLDACERASQSYVTGVITTATTTRIIAPSASNKTYICSFFVKASAVDSVGVYEGTGGTCGTGKAGVLGGTTTANGLVFGTAGDGLMMQAGGKVAVMQTTGTNVDFCLETSTTGPAIYGVKYVQLP